MKAGYKKAGLFLLIYVGLLLLFYFIAREQILYKEYCQEAYQKIADIGEIIDSDVIEQIVNYDGDYVESVSFQPATYARKNTGKIRIEVGTDQKVLAVKEYDVAQIKDNSVLLVNVKKETEKLPLHIKITSLGAEYGNAVTFYAAVGNESTEKLLRNGTSEDYSLCVAVRGGKMSALGGWYWQLGIVSGFLLTGILWWSFRDGRKNALEEHISRYRFLVSQLVKRDFKTKYKRSVLGFCWSFLNPLLTMMVQYVVFSTIFRSDIDNFPVYLLSAGIIFNFFTESVGGGLCAIVGNASLITKVYVPKYIYPFSKVLSTAINLIISMVPLFLAVLITGEEVTRAFLLIPFLLVCLIAFCVGMSLILSTSMVFFRDTQFLWGIVSLVWMYATPIFYPESIIPERFAFILQYNPMYHYLKFFRTILMQGVSPQLSEYVYCMGFAAIFCLIGAIIFRKAQNKFVLYL